VITGEEHARLEGDPKIVCSEPVRTIPYPDGRPGFLFLHLAYSQRAPEIFAAEEAERLRPRSDTVTVGGERWVVRHPKLDIGTVVDAFDGDPKTVARSARVNPAVWEIELPSVRPVSGVELELWTSAYDIELTVTGENGEAVKAEQSFRNLPPEPVVRVVLPRGVPGAVKLRISIRKVDIDSYVHLRELKLLGPQTAPEDS